MIVRYMERGFLVFILLLASHCQAAAPDLKIDLVLASAEHGDDENSQTTKIRIHGRRIAYEWIYGGYHPDENFKRHVKENATMTDAQVAALLKLIADRHLDMDQSLTPALGGSIGRSLNATFTFTRAGKTVTTHLSGMTDVWGSDLSGVTLLPDATVKALEAVADFVKSDVLDWRGRGK